MRIFHVVCATLVDEDQLYWCRLAGLLDGDDLNTTHNRVFSFIPKVTLFLTCFLFSFGIPVLRLAAPHYYCHTSPVARWVSRMWVSYCLCLDDSIFHRHLDILVRRVAGLILNGRVSGLNPNRVNQRMQESFLYQRTISDHNSQHRAMHRTITQLMKHSPYHTR